MKHTPAPWRVDDYPDRDAAVAVVNASDREVARASFEAPRSRAEREANARLIAAAPEMLALLEESQRNLTGDWRERRDALLQRLNGDEE